MRIPILALRLMTAVQSVLLFSCSVAQVQDADGSGSASVQGFTARVPGSGWLETSGPARRSATGNLVGDVR